MLSKNIFLFLLGVNLIYNANSGAPDPCVKIGQLVDFVYPIFVTTFDGYVNATIAQIDAYAAENKTQIGVDFDAGINSIVSKYFETPNLLSGPDAQNFFEYIASNIEGINIEDLKKYLIGQLPPNPDSILNCFQAPRFQGIYFDAFNKVNDYASNVINQH